MRTILLFLVWASAVSITIPAKLYDKQSDQCADILRDGVFNTHVVSSSAQNSESYRKWECTATFSNHNEAINAGLSVGLELFGVPLEVGGTWGQGQVDQWKNTHCTEEERKQSSSSTYYEYIRTADPNVLAAWSRCMEYNAPGGAAIACTIEHNADKLLFKSRWKRTAGENPNDAPNVSFYHAYDAACDREWKVGDLLQETDTTFVCSLPPFSKSVFVLETSRGNCTESDEILTTSYEFPAGKTVLSEIKSISADRIIFRDGSTLVTNGFRVYFNAVEIKVEGTSKIVSFEPRQNRPPGDSGRSVGPLVFKAERIAGNPLYIDIFGEDGTQGATGTKGGKGVKGSQGEQMGWDPISGCHGGRNGGVGGQGGNGGQGREGGRGGTGGSVFYAIKFGIGNGPVRMLDVRTTRDQPTRAKVTIDCLGPCGGLPGDGGLGGPGGDGGDGGDGAPGTSYCNGTQPGPPGPQGPTGDEGASGAAGAPGTIQEISLFLRTHPEAGVKGSHPTRPVTQRRKPTKNIKE